MKKESDITTLSIKDEHRILGLAKPRHPLVSVLHFEGIVPQEVFPERFLFDFYSISIKKNVKGKIRYGQKHFDFDSGIMTFMSPNQLVARPAEGDENLAGEGVCLNIHPDFFSGYPLAKTIREYGFFSYELSEALHLSDAEEEAALNIMNSIENEYHNNIDRFSQNVMIAQIELLLQYSDRYYNRQFITRKPSNDQILIRLESLLAMCFDDRSLEKNGLPTVQFVSEQLNVSPNYLSDMLRSITGQTTQQHIHNKLIDKAKTLLSTTHLSVAEIAYQLGFEYPQSFNKLFKKKESISPLEFRASFN
ncbi:MAG: helix-turn-helix domain-containing protein [Dyadobacter fermentans]